MMSTSAFNESTFNLGSAFLFSIFSCRLCYGGKFLKPWLCHLWGYLPSCNSEPREMLVCLREIFLRLISRIEMPAQATLSFNWFGLAITWLLPCAREVLICELIPFNRVLTAYLKSYAIWVKRAIGGWLRAKDWQAILESLGLTTGVVFMNERFSIVIKGALNKFLSYLMIIYIVCVSCSRFLRLLQIHSKLSNISNLVLL